MVPDAIRQFFAAYGAAFIRFDRDAVLAAYQTPAIQARGIGYVPCNTPSDLGLYVDSLFAMYRSRGAVSMEGDVRDYLPQGEHFALAMVDWTITWNTDEPPLALHATYNLFEESGSWRIIVATVYY